MSRLEADFKMGYYPTPSKSFEYISEWINVAERQRGGGNAHMLDPCCGEGAVLSALFSCLRFYQSVAWGIELDAERVIQAEGKLDHVIQSSIFDARVNPLGCMGLLWLNPPYTVQDGKRAEMEFLRHSVKWLCPSGVLVFIVPEHILLEDRHRELIGQHFQNIRVARLHKEDYPAFRQVVLFGVRRLKRVEDREIIPAPPYAHIEETEPVKYIVPFTEGPAVFQGGSSVTDEDVENNRARLLEEIKRITGYTEDVRGVSPLLPLRKGHLVSLITAGMLDGKIENPDGTFIFIKGFSGRTKDTRQEDDREITRETYRVGIRVMELEGWYDIH